ncbi:MAG: fibronectin type III domain-containing protein [Parabacteroides johnsonii]
MKWTAPENVSNITKYVIYLSADGKGRDTKLGEVEAGTNSYAIETSVTADTYIIVVTCNAQGESEALASVKSRTSHRTARSRSQNL